MEISQGQPSSASPTMFKLNPIAYDMPFSLTNIDLACSESFISTHLAYINEAISLIFRFSKTLQRLPSFASRTVFLLNSLNNLMLYPPHSPTSAANVLCSIFMVLSSLFIMYTIPANSIHSETTFCIFQ